MIYNSIPFLTWKIPDFFHLFIYKVFELILFHSGAPNFGITSLNGALTQKKIRKQESTHSHTKKTKMKTKTLKRLALTRLSKQHVQVLLS